ncbi:hypothetical protein CAMGR0001_2583 [Campylobacter gracilis RM3268]|uniref:Uncharacterized protein n=1 Tax=Campylobacter gracilis RM3268 TaxID=553220 RepID=C8PEU4_9BACT|nr:hypothetical protein CAMGR0001_2583 [Campylobacter gracilis RM3268]
MLPPLNLALRRSRAKAKKPEFAGLCLNFVAHAQQEYYAPLCKIIA